MTDDEAGGKGGGKNGVFWMASFVNDPFRDRSCTVN